MRIMVFFTSAGLKSMGAAGEMIRLSDSLRKGLTTASSSVFLSHSHVETSHIEDAKRILEANGASVYVDSEDPDMPSSTSSATAARLKEKIRGFDRFVLLASEKSLASRWVPWELGFADAAKGMPSIAILPFTSASGTWRGTEYVGLYSTIRPAEGGGVGVFEPDKNSGSKLSTWLRNKP